MENGNAPAKSGGGKDWFGAAVIGACMIVGVLIYMFVFGASGNFDAEGHPKTGGVQQIFGLIYKGGFLVPIAVGMLLTVIVISIERTITLSRASGSGSMDSFVQKVQTALNNGNIGEAMTECDNQKGSVGNVIKEVLYKYQTMEAEKGMDKEQKVLAIQKAQEEAVALELPILEKNFTILATIVSVATLVGLIGTVLGMIRSFAALAASGTPDTSALSTGISEALINTAIGISTSTIATIAYNYFTSKIDDMTYRMDEAGFSIVQTFAERHH